MAWSWSIWFFIEVWLPFVPFATVLGQAFARQYQCIWSSVSPAGWPSLAYLYSLMSANHALSVFPPFVAPTLSTLIHFLNWFGHFARLYHVVLQKLLCLLGLAICSLHSSSLATQTSNVSFTSWYWCSCFFFSTPYLFLYSLWRLSILSSFSVWASMLDLSCLRCNSNKWSFVTATYLGEWK